MLTVWKPGYSGNAGLAEAGRWRSVDLGPKVRPWLLFGLILAALPAWAADISGVWQITGEVGPDKPVPLCIFAQAGETLKGTCEGPAAVGEVYGTVSGEKILWNWSWRDRADDHPGSFTFKGTLNPTPP